MTTTHKLRLENLEAREMLAADLAFEPLTGDVYHDVASSTDVKGLSGTDLGSTRVKGLSGTDLGSGRIRLATVDLAFAQYGR